MDGEKIPVISKEQLFKQNNNVHIHLSTELEEFVGVMHKHKFIEIVYVVSGKAKHIMGKSEYAVKRGDVSIINPDEAHAFVPDRENSAEPFVAYDLMFTPDFVDNSCLSDEGFSTLGKSFLFYSLFSDSGDFKEKFNLIADCGYELGSVFEKIYDEYKAKRSGYINLIRLYIAEIVIRLSRKIDDADSRLTSSQKQIVMEIINYIENNYSIKIHSDEIAAKLFFNKNYISRLFKQETGLSIHEFVRKIRMKEAMKRLEETDDIITDIAADCGFNDMKSFYQMFKNFAGCTPKAYRDARKKE